MKPASPRPAFRTVYYTDAQMVQFYRSVRELAHDIGCAYLGYIVEDLSKNSRIGFASDPDWQREYVGAKLIEECHLWKTVNEQFIETSRDFFIFPWESAAAKTSYEKDIRLYRMESGIGTNGISFCSRKGSIREFFAIAPEPKNRQFLYHVSRNMELVRKHLSLFRQAACSATEL